MQKKILALLLLLLFPIGAYSTEVLCENMLATGSLWLVTVNFSGSFDKASVYLDSMEISTIYYNNADNVVTVKQDSLDLSKVNSYSAKSGTLSLVLYPLDEGKHNLKVSMLSGSSLVEEKMEEIEFVSSSYIFSTVQKINDITKEIDSINSGLESLKSDNNRLNDSISGFQGRLEDLKGELEGSNAMISELGGQLTSTRGGLSTVSGKVDSLEEGFVGIKLSQDKLNAEKDKGILPTAFAVLGNAAFPLAVVAVLIAVFFIFSYIKNRKGDSLYGDVDYPGPGLKK